MLSKDNFLMAKCYRKFIVKLYKNWVKPFFVPEPPYLQNIKINLLKYNKLQMICCLNMLNVKVLLPICSLATIFCLNKYRRQVISIITLLVIVTIICRHLFFSFSKRSCPYADHPPDKMKKC